MHIYWWSLIFGCLPSSIDDKRFVYSFCYVFENVELPVNFTAMEQCAHAWVRACAVRVAGAYVRVITRVCE